MAADVLSALKAVDDAIEAEILSELEGFRPQFEAALEATLPRLREAFAAKDAAEKQIAEVDETIAKCREKAAEYAAAMDDPDVEQAVTARFYHQGYCDEVSKLKDKRQELTEAMQPVIGEHHQAQAEMQRAQARLEALEQNSSYPYLGFGQQTAAYRAYRIGSWSLWVGALQGIVPLELDALFDGLDEIAVNTGYRTTDLDRRRRERARAESLESYRETFPGAEQSAFPTGQDIRDAIHQSMEAQKAAQSPVYPAEDYRRPAAQNAAVREYMQLPGSKR